MKITVLYAAMPNYEHGLDIASRFVTDTLKELGEEVDTFNLAYQQIPYYDGISSVTIEPIVRSLQDSQGVVFAVATSMLGPCALIKTFLEHLESDSHNQILQGKSCLILTTSQTGGERTTLEYLSHVIGSLGGNDAVRIAFGGDVWKNIESDEELQTWIERQTENFYRVVRQNPKFVVPSYEGGLTSSNKVKPTAPPTPTKAPQIPQDTPPQSFSAPVVEKPEPYTPLQWEAPVTEPRKDTITAELESLSDDEYFALFGEPKKKPPKVAELYKKHESIDLSPEQKNDISEITQFFAQKYVTTEKGIVPAQALPSIDKDFSHTAPSGKTVKQLTYNLPHYFSSHLAGDLTARIQLQISGMDSFQAYILIEEGSCDIIEGTADHHDIVILASERAWSDVLRGKLTAQKAFMVGQLKVRGNFLLLGKFDQLFQPQPK